MRRFQGQISLRSDTGTTGFSSLPQDNSGYMTVIRESASVRKRRLDLKEKQR